MTGLWAYTAFVLLVGLERVAELRVSQRNAAFWDELAQFYRRAYLRWIDATKRSPALRAERIAAVVSLLERGVKARP